MKLTMNALGQSLLALMTAFLVITSGYILILPALQNYSSKALVSETNLTENSIPGPILACPPSEIVVNVNDPVNIFSGITARTQSGYNLIAELQSDYRKPLFERKNVFIYRICDDHSSVLKSEIDTSKEGTWEVVFSLQDNGAFTTEKVRYRVFDPEIIIIS